ncbi:MAG: asparagine synthase (glutamine-hydrolyzing) [Burkholderiales bacterium]|nr:asparagine synthase (glutamine-hydrolyzing) [Burkholderiales bacterium]
MCGINGIFAYADAARPVDEAELLRTREHMAKRGPDGAGLWISPDRKVGLAHRRLAIIDLAESGAQPMATADGRLTITYNGEIYNYRELRRELEAKGYLFHSQSDTEVLLHLYADRGAEFVHVLRGMFAFAVWDARERTLLLARDPFGIKPLYYADDGNTLRFASQVKALLAAEAIDIMPEPAASVGFLLWGCVPEPYTLYRNIHCLPAGSTLTLRMHGQIATHSYFSVRDTLDRAQRDARPFGAGDRTTLGDALRDSVRHHLVADVPVGMFLSAGVDSSLIARLAAAEKGAGLRSLTLGFSEYRGSRDDEAPLAEKVAAALGTVHETHWIEREDFSAQLGHILDAMDQPSTDGVNSYFICREAARAGIKVALSGLGGDEIFGGYPSFRDVPRLARWLRAAALVPFLGRLARAATGPLLSRITSPKFASLLEYGGTYEGAYLLRRALYLPWELSEVLDPIAVQAGLGRLDVLGRVAEASKGLSSPHARVCSIELALYMRNQLLRDTDWAGMAHSIEVRVPLVDLRLFQGIAPWLVSESPPRKADAAATAAIPHGREIVLRPKTGFSVPVREWIAGDQRSGAAMLRGLRGWARKVLSDAPAGAALTLPAGTRRSAVVAGIADLLYCSTNGALRLTARMLWPGERPGTARRICVYRIGSIGDILCTLPAVRAVRQAYPDAHLTYFSSPGGRGMVGAPEVLAGIDWIDEVLPYYGDDIDSIAGRLALLRALRARRIDIWVELPNNLSSVYRQVRDMLFTRLAGVGWATGWSVDTIRFGAAAQTIHRRFENEVERVLNVVRHAGIEVSEADFGLPRRPSTEATVSARLEAALGPAEMVAALAPGAKRETNRWPLERFIEVGRFMREAGAKVAVLGGAGDAVDCRRIADGIGAGAASFAGQLSIAESAELLRRCAVLACVDSGVQHMASAVGTPTVSLFSFWQMRGKWRPYGARNVVLQKWVDCHTCMLQRCPRDNLCMRRIQATEVASALAPFLGLAVRSGAPDRAPQDDDRRQVWAH